MGRVLAAALARRLWTRDYRLRSNGFDRLTARDFKHKPQDICYYSR